MSNIYARLGILMLLVLFSIFFGVSLASKGMERVHGPLPLGKSEASIKPQGSVQPLKVNAVNKNTKPELTKQKNAAGQAPIETNTKDSFMNNLGNKLGSLIQIVAHHSIQGVISIFDSMLSKK